MAKIISISNQKGGVGKTTTTVNLAASLAACEKSILVIDMDPQGNAGSYLGLSPTDCAEKDIYNCLVDPDKDINECICNTELDNLKIIPSTTNLSGAEVELVTEIAREQRLKNCINKIKDQFDYIFIDCPPSLGLLTINALTSSNEVLVPLQAEYFALEGLSQLVKTIKLIKSSVNQSLEIRGIVLTMVDTRNNICKQVEDEVRGHFKELVFKTFIPRNVKLSESPSHGKPNLLYDIRSKGTQAYLDLAKEFLLKEKQDSLKNSVENFNFT